ncbi:MAG: hypothetical protein AW10_03967 [Candidatus Accumulibacter appositus]|uniref:Uncharacterized protein n=1 Tax=Candidatus Accumulibacter appositus TaxID=1454003 RepID=A0A011NPD4_9PROT|nr:MAG: hypothetical protein AW10_03967 [Candidatus Accumulibacter appositus]
MDHHCRSPIARSSNVVVFPLLPALPRMLLLRSTVGLFRLCQRRRPSARVAGLLGVISFPTAGNGSIPAVPVSWRQRPLRPRPGPTVNRAWRRVSDRLADVLAGRFFAASTFPDGRFYATGTAPKAAAVRTGELGVRQRVVGHVEKCGYRRAGSRRTFCSLSRHLTGRASGIALANVGLSILEMLVQAPDSRLRRAVLLGTPCPGSCRPVRAAAARDD